MENDPYKVLKRDIDELKKVKRLGAKLKLKSLQKFIKGAVDFFADRAARDSDNYGVLMTRIRRLECRMMELFNIIAPEYNMKIIDIPRDYKNFRLPKVKNRKVRKIIRKSHKKRKKFFRIEEGKDYHAKHGKPNGKKSRNRHNA